MFTSQQSQKGLTSVGDIAELANTVEFNKVLEDGGANKFGV